MRYTVQDRLRELGCRSFPKKPELVSLGAGFLRSKEIERIRAANAEYWEREEARRASRENQRNADLERLKQLGGTTRTRDEEHEFMSIIVRTGRSREYFERRAWEKLDGVAA
jgi:hypothetical protein